MSLSRRVAICPALGLCALAEQSTAAALSPVGSWPSREGSSWRALRQRANTVASGAWSWCLAATGLAPRAAAEKSAQIAAGRAPGLQRAYAGCATLADAMAIGACLIEQSVPPRWVPSMSWLDIRRAREAGFPPRRRRREAATSIASSALSSVYRPRHRRPSMIATSLTRWCESPGRSQLAQRGRTWQDTPGEWRPKWGD